MIDTRIELWCSTFAPSASSDHCPLCSEDEVVTAHQTTLLKLVDSYLHASQQAHEVALSGRHTADRGRSLFDVLTESFFALSKYAQDAIQRALGSGRTSPPREARSNPPPSTEVAEEEQPDAAPPPLQNLDLLLPKVCEALVLVTQCLTTVALRAEEAAPAATRPGDTQSMHLSPKDLLVAATAERSGPRLVESLIGAPFSCVCSRCLLTPHTYTSGHVAVSLAAFGFGTHRNTPARRRVCAAHYVWESGEAPGSAGRSGCVEAGP